MLCTVLILGYMYHLLKLFLSVTSSFYQISAINRARLGGVYLRMLRSSVQLRAMDKVTYLDEEFYDNSNKYQAAASHLGNVAQRWLGVRNFFCATILLFMVQSFPLLGLNTLEDFFDLNGFWKISMAIAWGIKTIGYINKFMGSINALSIDLITIEKCYDWIDHEEIEGQIGLRPYKRDDRYMALEMQNIDLTYDQKNWALKECSVHVRCNERVGLLGDTGAGKYDIPMVALGLAEVQVNLDNSNVGRDPKQVGVRVFNQPLEEINKYELRKACGYLYKDAKLFAGTVRDNIEPERKVKDAIMIKVLHWLKIMEVLDDDQKVIENALNGREAEIDSDFFEDGDANWGKTESSLNKTPPIELNDLPPKTPVSRKSGSRKLCNLASPKDKDFISFLTTYMIASKNEVKILKKYLNSKVEAEGKNFEESQRKIILIAKELIKQPDILFMEEGCIDVPDLEDKFFFEALFSHLPNTTIVTILNSFDY